MFFLWVFIIPHLLENGVIIAKVLHEVGILMKDRTDDHLHIGRMVSEYEQGIDVIIIATIGGGITRWKGLDAELKGPLPRWLITNMFLTPLDGGRNNMTEFFNRQVLGRGLEVYFHKTKIMKLWETTKKDFPSVGGAGYL